MIKLKNGAKIVQLETRKKDYQQFVLAFWSGHTCPWVTWAMDSEGNTYWGHYFGNEESARLDLAKRIEGAK